MGRHLVCTQGIRVRVSVVPPLAVTSGRVRLFSKLNPDVTAGTKMLLLVMLVWTSAAFVTRIKQVRLLSSAPRPHSTVAVRCFGKADTPVQFWLRAPMPLKLNGEHLFCKQAGAGSIPVSGPTRARCYGGMAGFHPVCPGSIPGARTNVAVHPADGCRLQPGMRSGQH